MKGHSTINSVSEYELDVLSTFCAGNRNTPSRFMLQTPEIYSMLMGHLSRMQTLLLPFVFQDELAHVLVTLFDDRQILPQLLNNLFAMEVCSLTKYLSTVQAGQKSNWGLLLSVANARGTEDCIGRDLRHDKQWH